MSKPSKLEEIFMPMLLEMDLLSEWGRLVKAKAHASIFVGFFTELMRDEIQPANRRSSMAFLSFLRGRTWPEIFEVFSRYGDPEDLEALKDPFAEEFFASFSMMALQQIQEYYEQFLEHRKNMPRHVITPGELPPAPGVERAEMVGEIVDEVIVEIRKVVMEPGLGGHPFIQELIRELKKLMDEGEDWKKQ